MMTRSRGNWQGMWTIFRFNWPLYVMALIPLALGLWAVIAGEILLLRLAGAAAAAGAIYFLVGSLGVSHWIYDRSDLYRWKWLGRALAGCEANQLAFCHSGFDEASKDLRELLGGNWIVLDHYDAARMPEPSIQRARKIHPPTSETQSAAYDSWPVTEESLDLVFGLLAIHELRSENERTAWFAEAKRCLRKQGRIVLAEHIRDLANLLAFGPGFLHFHAEASWSTCWTKAGLHCRDRFAITPWIRVFVLEKP